MHHRVDALAGGSQIMPIAEHTGMDLAELADVFNARLAFPHEQPQAVFFSRALGERRSEMACGSGDQHRAFKVMMDGHASLLANAVPCAVLHIETANRCSWSCLRTAPTHPGHLIQPDACRVNTNSLLFSQGVVRSSRRAELRSRRKEKIASGVAYS